MPAIPARMELLAKVMAMVRCVSMPINVAASLSWATARMVLPRVVLRKKSHCKMSNIPVMTMTNKFCLRMLTSPKWMTP